MYDLKACSESRGMYDLLRTIDGFQINQLSKKPINQLIYQPTSTPSKPLVLALLHHHSILAAIVNQLAWIGPE